MESRAIAVHGGGDLVVGESPKITGLVSCHVSRPSGHRTGGSYAFKLGWREAQSLAEALRFGRPTRLRTFGGTAIVSLTNALAYIYFYPCEEKAPEYVVRLYEGAIEAAAEAIAEAAEEARDDGALIWRSARRFESPRAAA